MGGREARPDVSGGVVVWEDGSARLPRGARRIVGGQVQDLWVYNWSTSPDDRVREDTPS